KEAQQYQRLAARVAGHVRLARGNQDRVAGAQLVVAAVGLGAPLSRQHVDALLGVGMKMTPAGRVARIRHGDLDAPQRHGLRAARARHDLERAPPGEPELARLRGLDDARHQSATFRCLTSAVPPCASSSMRKSSLASFAMASAMSASIFTPLSTVACSGAPYQPVGAMVRMSRSTGWKLRVRRSLSHLRPCE